MCLGGYRKLVVSNHIPISITTGDVLYAKWHAESGVEFAGSLNGTKVVNRYMGSRLLFFSPLVLITINVSQFMKSMGWMYAGL